MSNLGGLNNFTLQGAQVQAQTIAITATDPTRAGELVLGSSITTTQTSNTQSSETAGLWQSQSGSGSTTQTANLTKLDGKVNIDPNLKVTVQTGSTAPSAQNLQTQIQALSQQPGLTYLKDLQANPAVKWEQLQLANEQWNYSQQGLTPAGAALLSIAIAAYTGGMGAELLGTTTTTAATATTAAASTTTLGGVTLATSAGGLTAAGAAANAGFAALTAQAGVALVNNGGDIGKTLAQLGSSESLRNIALSMASAGTLSELGTTLGLDKITVKDGFTANLGKAVVNNLASAGITSALTGTGLEANIRTALVSSLIAAGAGQAANTIGDLASPGANGAPPALNAAGQALAHALAGCVAGAAGQGSGGCQAGAAGAVVGELVAKWANPSDDPAKLAQTLELVKVTSAAAAVLAGGNAQSVATAVMTGVNAALNNRMLHPLEANLIKSNAQRYAQQRYGTSTPSVQQIEAAQAELANTAQSLVDNNLGATVPYVAQAADFLAQLKVEYMQQHGSLNLPGTAGSAGGTQQLFYATVEQKNMPWLNQGLADPAVTGLIVKTPINPPKTPDLQVTNRDRLTGLPLDDKGRYEVSLTLDGKSYSPKYYPCATAECVKSGGNLDMSDAATRAYMKALDKKVMDDINTAATAGTIVAPVGVVGNTLAIVGPLSSIAGGAIDGQSGVAAAKEALQFGAAQYLSKVYGFSDSLVNRITATVDLAGGWAAFINRAKEEITGVRD